MTAPSYTSFQSHGFFSGVLTAVAAVTAALFVAFALGARFYFVRAGQALFAIVAVAVSEVAAIAGLSPSLPHWLYKPLLAFAVAGGVFTLIAAMSSAVAVVRAETAQRESGALGGPEPAPPPEGAGGDSGV